jgi:hypothetical protein
MSSERSKRRKLDEEVRNEWNEINDQSLDNPLPSESIVAEVFHEPFDFDYNISDPYDHISDLESETSFNYSSDNSDIELSFKDNLRSWAIQHNITAVATDDLLKILIPAVPECYLPLSSKTLLNTPVNYTIDNFQGGQYFHFGIRRFLEKLNPNVDDKFLLIENLSLSIGIDGLPISRSSKKQFWPIIATIEQCSKISPFLIGLFLGNSKPLNVKEYLNPLITELKTFKTNKIFLNGVAYGIIIKCVIADTPARNYIKQSAAFNGYYGCERCTHKGTWVGRVIFKDLDSPLRSNSDFRNKCELGHHHGDSPFLEIDINLVNDFVLDYMHLVCLGIMKKLLHCWIKGPLPHKVGRHLISVVSEFLLEFRKRIPSEFNRKCRSLSEIEFWKATEYRMFLLYLGPVILKNILSVEKYCHFLKLSVAIRILVSENKLWYNFARSLLRQFVQEISILYCEEFLVFNVHSLIHLADDAERFGSLDKISAFPYENYMQTLKKMLRGKSNHLSQVIRRVIEKESVDNNSVSLHQNLRKISTKVCDCCFSNTNGDILCVVGEEDEFVNVKIFRTKIDFFTNPCESSRFGIYLVSNLSKSFKKIKKEKLCNKFMMLQKKLSCDNEFVVMPLCGCNSEL